MATCPVCEGDIEEEKNWLVGELVQCADCGSELEVKSLEPAVLAEAPEAEEDWGE